MKLSVLAQVLNNDADYGTYPVYEKALAALVREFWFESQASHKAGYISILEEQADCQLLKDYVTYKLERAWASPNYREGWKNYHFLQEKMNNLKKLTDKLESLPSWRIFTKMWYEAKLKKDEQEIQTQLVYEILGALFIGRLGDENDFEAFAKQKIAENIQNLYVEALKIN